MAYLHLFWKPQALRANKVDFISYPYGRNVGIKMSFQFGHSSLKAKKLILYLLLCAFVYLCVLGCAAHSCRCPKKSEASNPPETESHKWVVSCRLRLLSPMPAPLQKQQEPHMAQRFTGPVHVDVCFCFWFATRVQKTSHPTIPWRQETFSRKKASRLLTQNST